MSFVLVGFDQILFAGSPLCRQVSITVGRQIPSDSVVGSRAHKCTGTVAIAHVLAAFGREQSIANTLCMLVAVANHTSRHG
jgi:hypothetical protein